MGKGKGLLESRFFTHESSCTEMEALFRPKAKQLLLQMWCRDRSWWLFAGGQIASKAMRLHCTRATEPKQAQTQGWYIDGEAESWV